MYNMVIGKITNSSKEIFTLTELNVLNTTFDDFSQLQIDITESNSDSYEIFNKYLVNLLNSIQKGDICSISTVNQQIEQCDSKLNYISNFGGDIILSAYYENLRLALEDAYTLQNETDMNKRIQVLNGEHYYYMNVLIEDYLKGILDLWKNELLVFIKDYLNIDLYNVYKSYVSKEYNISLEAMKEEVFGKNYNNNKNNYKKFTKTEPKPIEKIKNIENEIGGIQLAQY